MVSVSYLFYMLWEPAYALILLGITLVTFYGARWLPSGAGLRRSMVGVALSVIALGALVVFKYYNFVNTTISGLLASMDIDFALPGLNWIIPIGISFFSFQAVGYFLDVYHRRINPEMSLLNYVLFISFFPQITSGPISKASELIPQLADPQPFSYSRATSGLRWILWGMFLKTVVADQLGLSVDAIYKDYQYYNGATLAMACLFFAIQIYADFAGYSFMAMGIARTLGINLINNFRQPYFSESITDFWRRWHISLSRWLKDYVYIPLGGNRKGKFRSYVNILITFIVSGLWHGANWTFVVWGLMHGGAQVAEKVTGLNRRASRTVIERVARTVVTFVVVALAWVFFRMPTIGSAWTVVSRIVTLSGSGVSYVPTNTDALMLATAILALLIMDCRTEFRPTWRPRGRVARYALYVMAFVMILLMGVLDSGQFIYVNF